MQFAFAGLLHLEAHVDRFGELIAPILRDQTSRGCQGLGASESYVSGKLWAAAGGGG